MKIIKWACAIITFGIANAASAKAQKSNYQFFTGSNICLTPGQSIPIELLYNDVRPVIAVPIKWDVNGEPSTV